MRRILLLVLGCVTGNGTAGAASDNGALIPGGRFRSALATDETRIAPFRLARTPVTNAQFLEFVRRHPEWRRDRVAPLFADTRYLQHWQAADALGAGAGATEPVVNVSWFAASAYCEAQHGRLPNWLEWEYAAAASTTRSDARDEPAFQQQMLTWYARTADKPEPVGRGAPNRYGIHDLHALVWEWVGDFSALMVSNDSRDQGEDPDRLKFCGSSALTAADKTHYAVLMRVAMLSSLKAQYTTTTLGFRCAWEGKR